jgi:hypothetical protein
VREAVPFVLLGCACGAALGHATPPAGSSTRTTESATDGAPSTAAAFDALASVGLAVAPGMHEVARRETRGERADLVGAEGRDVCVRVAFKASAPVLAKLLDGDGKVLAARTTVGIEGVLGELGPICVRKGEVVACMAEGGPALLQWMAWEAP